MLKAGAEWVHWPKGKGHRDLQEAEGLFPEMGMDYGLNSAREVLETVGQKRTN
jgi:hypothetical protein